jgi:hypothetical protein
MKVAFQFHTTNQNPTQENLKPRPINELINDAELVFNYFNNIPERNKLIAPQGALLAMKSSSNPNNKAG